jgi:CoA-transferase family III
VVGDERFHAEWGEADVDVDGLWAASGGQWLTSSDVPVPHRLIRSIVGLVRFLDARGAGLSDELGASGVGVIAERAAASDLTRSGVVSCGGATRLLRCADGWIAVTLARAEDFESIPAWLGVQPDAEPWPSIARTVADLFRADIVDRAVLLGLACSAIGETQDRRPVLLERAGNGSPSSMARLVVVNLASLWAGPLAADVLARLGARVITVESESRPDGARAVPSFFEALHGRCESVALGLGDECGRRRLRDLLASVDIVVEGSRPRALEQMGIDARSMVANGPRLWLSITGYGRATPYRDRIGFGDDAAAAGGLVGWVGDQPRFLADAIADPITGLVAAATAVQLVEHGARAVADIAMSRVAASMSNGPTTAMRLAGRPALPPRRRRDRGRPLPLGRDTDAVLDEFGIP